MLKDGGSYFLGVEIDEFMVWKEGVGCDSDVNGIFSVLQRTEGRAKVCFECKS